MMRVYIPATLEMLQQLVADGSLQPLSGTAFAVTPTLREAYSHGDDEELAEIALREAALASVRLLAVEQGERASDDALPLRRAVLVADADAKLRPDLDDAVVRIEGRVTLDRIVAAYVDNSDAEPAVAAAIAVIDDADLGDTDAEFVIADAQDFDLAWYATQELPFLLDLL
jgi:hypothetical protein